MLDNLSILSDYTIDTIVVKRSINPDKTKAGYGGKNKIDGDYHSIINDFNNAILNTHSVLIDNVDAEEFDVNVKLTKTTYNSTNEDPENILIPKKFNEF